MTKFFKTETGSTYEIQEGRFRRLEGPQEARHRASGGEWLPYAFHTPLEPGRGVRFVLEGLREDGAIRTLVTSHVVEVWQADLCDE